jgi:predicted anti-sigma-YlaC factor YlaD
MIRMTHEEARKLIHLSLDGSLNNQQKRMLDQHLASCQECRQHANSLHKMESILRPFLRRQWTEQPVPVLMDMLVSQSSIRNSNSMMLATRIAAIGVMFMVFVFSAWQFTLSRPSAGPSIPAAIPLIPVPSTSTQLVATRTQNGTCEQTTYVVRIALKFGISKAELLQANDLRAEIVYTGNKLLVPLCQPTPTNDTLTKTYTPILKTITSTPGG